MMEQGWLPRALSELERAWWQLPLAGEPTLSSVHYKWPPFKAILFCKENDLVTPLEMEMKQISVLPFFFF